MNDWKDSPIKHRWDGSYVIAYAGYPEYHVPNDEEFASLWAEVDAYAQAHPEHVTEEPAPPEPTAEELLERAKVLKTAEFDRAMAEVDGKLVRASSDITAAMLTPETLAETDEPSQAATELEHSKYIFTELRALQVQNRALRAQMLAAETVEAVEAISPVQLSQNTLESVGTQSLDSYLPNN